MMDDDVLLVLVGDVFLVSGLYYKGLRPLLV